MKTKLPSPRIIGIALIFALFALVNPGIAVDETAELDPETVEAAKRLMTTMKVKEQMAPSLEHVQSMQDSILDQQTNLTDEQKAVAKETARASMSEMMKVLAWENMEPMFIRVYASVFSADELNRLNEYFASKDGQVYVNKQPKLQAAMVAEMGKMMGAIMPKIQEKTQEAIERVQKRKKDKDGN